jgi:hypothetical protein
MTGGINAALEARRLRNEVDAFQRQNNRCFDCGRLVRQLGQPSVQFGGGRHAPNDQQSRLLEIDVVTLSQCSIIDDVKHAFALHEFHRVACKIWSILIVRQRQIARLCSGGWCWTAASLN